jgi:phosphohistidine phosphatase SixA
VQTKSFGSLLFLWLLIAAAGSSSAEPRGAALLEALQAGGHNIYVRHAATDWSQQDRIERAGDWTSCDPDRVRQLSDRGRATATAVGEAIRALDIPVGEVLASPYCRTMETARLMDLGEVQPSTDVMNLRSAAYFGGRAAVIASAQALLSSPPPDGTNRVIVAHGNVARNATPVYPGEAEAVLFRPDGNGGFDVIARIEPSQWRDLLIKP